MTLPSGPTPPSPDAAQPVQPPQEEKKRRRWLPLLWLLLCPCCTVCALLTPSELMRVPGRPSVAESVLSKLAADYGVWPGGQFQPLDPELIQTIQSDQLTAAGDSARFPTEIVRFMTSGTGTQIALVPATPTPTATSTRTPTPTATSTLLPTGVIFPGPFFTRTPTPTDTPFPPTPTPIPPTPLPSANLAITKTDGATYYTPGGGTVYTIVVTNAGPANVNNARVRDTFPANITGTAWTCTPSALANCDTAAGAGNISVTVDLPVGESVTFSVTATISGVAAGNLVNTATVTPPANRLDPALGNNTATDTDLFPQADLVVTKSKSDGSPTKAWPGGALTYTITVSNAGPFDANGATVTDTFSGINTISWSCVADPGSSCGGPGGGNISDTVNLQAGDSVTYTVNAIQDAAPTSGTLSNTASVMAPGTVIDPNLANNSATVSDTIAPPTVVVTLTWNANTPGVGTESVADLDLYVVDGAGNNVDNNICVPQDTTLCPPVPAAPYGQVFSGDVNCGPGTTPPPDSAPTGNQEQAIWTGASGSPLGTYTVNIDYFNFCLIGTDPNVNWTVTFSVDGGIVQTNSGTVDLSTAVAGSNLLSFTYTLP